MKRGESRAEASPRECGHLLTEGPQQQQLRRIKGEKEKKKPFYCQNPLYE